MSNVDGIDRLLQKLNRLGVNSEKVLEKSIKKNIKFVQGEAKNLCPVDSGELRNSIKSKTEVNEKGIVAAVTTNVEYAPYQEFGTGQKGNSSPTPPKYDGNLAYRQDWKGIPAQPFLYPALKNNEDKVMESIQEDLKEEIRKVVSR